MQESVVLSECRTLSNMTFWPQMSCYLGFSREVAFIYVKCYFLCVMKICKFESTYVLKKFAHNITQCEDREKKIEFPNDIFAISHTTIEECTVF